MSAAWQRIGWQVFPVLSVLIMAAILYLVAPLLSSEAPVMWGIQLGALLATGVVLISLLPTLLRRHDQLMGVLLALFWGFGVRLAGLVFVLLMSRHTSCDPQAMLLTAVAVVAWSSLADAMCFAQRSWVESEGASAEAVASTKGEETAVA